MTLGNGTLILLVDDDYFLEVNRILLDGVGYRVVTARIPGGPRPNARHDALR
jgi:hypothetical protein